MTVLKHNTTATSAAIAATVTVPAGASRQLISCTLHLGGDPTTPELFTVTLDANAGAAYDTVLYSLDLSTGTTVDLVWMPDQPLWLEGGDQVDVAYPNTEDNTYGIQITMKSDV